MKTEQFARVNAGEVRVGDRICCEGSYREVDGIKNRNGWIRFTFTDGWFSIDFSPVSPVSRLND